jgi:hypothetical protein
MAGHQPQYDQYGEASLHSDEGKSLDWNGNLDEIMQLVQQFNAPQTHLPTADPTPSSSPAYMNAELSSGFRFDNGLDEFHGTGLSQSDLDAFGREQTYQNPTQHQQPSTPINALTTPPSTQASPHPDANTLCDADLFWVQYRHGAHIGRDLYPNWKGIKEDDRPPRETIRLIPDVDRNFQLRNGRLRHLMNKNREVIRSDLTNEPLFDLPFLPRYIDVKADGTSKNVDNWIIMGADLRRDIIPRSHNYNQYFSFDEDGVEFFDWESTTAHLQRTYTNKHLKRAKELHVMGGLVRKFRMDKGRFAEFLTPIDFDEDCNQRRLLISMEKLLFNTRWDIDLERMVMRNPHSHQELPLFTPSEIRPAVRDFLKKQGYTDVPTLCDLWEKYPHIVGYDESKHPLMSRAADHDAQLRKDAELLAAQRGDRRPPVTNTEPNYQKGVKKGIKTKRKRAQTQNLAGDSPEPSETPQERPQKCSRNDGNHLGNQPFTLSAPAELAKGSNRPIKTLRSPRLSHQNHHTEQQTRQPIPYQQALHPETFRKASHLPMNLLLQPLGIPDPNIVPEELNSHPCIDCLNEHGRRLKVDLADLYLALPIAGRQTYGTIRDLQGVEVAKHKLLEYSRMREVIVPLAHSVYGNGAGLAPAQFNGDTSFGQFHYSKVQQDVATLSEQQTQNYYSQLIDSGNGLNQFQLPSFQPNLGLDLASSMGSSSSYGVQNSFDNDFEFQNSSIGDPSDSLVGLPGIMNDSRATSSHNTAFDLLSLHKNVSDGMSCVLDTDTKDWDQFSSEDIFSSYPPIE